LNATLPVSILLSSFYKPLTILFYFLRLKVEEVFNPLLQALFFLKLKGHLSKAVLPNLFESAVRTRINFEAAGRNSKLKTATKLF